MTAGDLGGDNVGRFARYWLELRGAAGDVPPRSVFSPERVVDLLPNLIVVEHMGGDEFRYRLLGTTVDWFTRDRYTGRRTSEIEGHGPGNAIHALYVETLRTKGMVGVTMPYVGTSGICKSVHQIAVPFRGPDGDQIISLIEFNLVMGVQMRILTPVERSLL